MKTDDNLMRKSVYLDGRQQTRFVKERKKEQNKTNQNKPTNQPKNNQKNSSI